MPPGARAGTLDHGRRHVHADRAALRADPARGEEDVETATRAEVEHHLARRDLRVGERAAAAEAQVRLLGDRLDLLVGVANLFEHSLDRSPVAPAIRGA